MTSLTIEKYLEKNNDFPKYLNYKITLDPLKKSIMIGRYNYDMYKYTGEISLIDNKKSHMGFNGLGSLDNLYLCISCRNKNCNFYTMVIFGLKNYKIITNFNVGLSFRFHSRIDNYVAFESKGFLYLLDFNTREFVNLPKTNPKHQIILFSSGYYIIDIETSKIINKIKLDYTRIFYKEIVGYCYCNREIMPEEYDFLLTDEIYNQVKTMFDESNENKTLYDFTINSVDALDRSSKYNDIGPHYNNDYLVFMAKCCTHYEYEYEYYYVIYDYKYKNIKDIIATGYGLNGEGIYGKCPRFYGISNYRIYFDDGSLVEYRIKKKSKRRTKMCIGLNENQTIFPLDKLLVCYTKVYDRHCTPRVFVSHMFID